MKIEVEFVKLRENAVVPKYATENSAGADLSACIDEEYTLKAGEIKMIPTGIAISPKCPSCVALIYGRSGLGCKKGITLANCVGVVDSDYRGEINVALVNHSSEDYTIKPGERIAQIVFTPVMQGVFTEVSELDATERGEGGFGSTGKQ